MRSFLKQKVGLLLLRKYILKPVKPVQDIYLHSSSFWFCSRSFFFGKILSAKILLKFRLQKQHSKYSRLVRVTQSLIQNFPIRISNIDQFRLLCSQKCKTILHWMKGWLKLQSNIYYIHLKFSYTLIFTFKIFYILTMKQKL